MAKHAEKKHIEGGQQSQVSKYFIVSPQARRREAFSHRIDFFCVHEIKLEINCNNPSPAQRKETYLTSSPHAAGTEDRTLMC